MIKRSLDNIRYHKTSFITNVIYMTVVFTLIFLVIFGTLFLKSFVKSKENENKGIVYLNILSKDEVDNLQKELLKENGIISLQYEPKDVAFAAISAELGLKLNENENPLSDAMYVYVDNDVNLEQLKHKLESYKEISEVDLRSNAINQNRYLQEQTNKFLVFISIGVIIFMLVVINQVSTFNVKSKENDLIKHSATKGLTFIKTSFFIENMIIFLVAYIISLIVFSQIKSYISNIIYSISLFKYTPKTSDETILSIFVLIFVIIISAFVNYISLNLYYRRKINKTSKIGDFNKKDEELV